MRLQHLENHAGIRWSCSGILRVHNLSQCNIVIRRQDMFKRFNRRETLAMLGAFAAKPAIGAPDSTLRFSGLDHIAIAAADTEKSVAFYSRIFWHDVLKDSRSARRYFNIGNGYIAIAPPALG